MGYVYGVLVDNSAIDKTVGKRRSVGTVPTNPPEEYI